MIQWQPEYSPLHYKWPHWWRQRTIKGEALAILIVIGSLLNFHNSNQLFQSIYSLKLNRCFWGLDIVVCWLMITKAVIQLTVKSIRCSKRIHLIEWERNKSTAPRPEAAALSRVIGWKHQASFVYPSKSYIWFLDLQLLINSCMINLSHEEKEWK